MPPPSWLLSTLARNGADPSLAVDPALEPDGRPGKESNAEGVVRAGERIQLLLRTADQGLFVVREIDDPAEQGELFEIPCECKVEIMLWVYDRHGDRKRTSMNSSH